MGTDREQVFVDPAGSTHYYKEFEINAANATWALCLNKPYLNGGYENSSRTFPGAGWGMPRARSAVRVEGELNRPGPPWRRWTVELALPLRDLMLNNTRRRPADGSAPLRSAPLRSPAYPPPRPSPSHRLVWS